LKALIITGSKNSGKTTLLKKIFVELKNRNKNVSGILSVAVIKDGYKKEYYIHDLHSGRKEKLCSVENTGSTVTAGRFGFYVEGLNSGLQALSLISDFIFIDEIGLLEVKGQGWASALDDFVDENDSVFVLGIRKDIVKKVVGQWNIKIIEFIDLDIASNIDINLLINKILEYESK